MTPQEIEQIIDMLVEKLGPIGGQVWSIYVRQVYISAIVTLVAAFLLIMATIGATIGLIWCAKQYRKTKAANPRSYGVGEYQMVGIAVSTIITVIAGVMTPLMLIDGLLRLLNTEYYAIQMLLGR